MSSANRNRIIWRCQRPRLDPDGPMRLVGPNISTVQRAIGLLRCEALLDAGRFEEAEAAWISCAVAHFIDVSTRTTRMNPTEGERLTGGAGPPTPFTLGDASE